MASETSAGCALPEHGLIMLYFPATSKLSLIQFPFSRGFKFSHRDGKRGKKKLEENQLERSGEQKSVVRVESIRVIHHTYFLSVLPLPIIYNRRENDVSGAQGSKA